MAKSEDGADDINEYRNAFKDVADDEGNCKHIYEAMFFTESLT